jgi:gas vesicle protein
MSEKKESNAFFWGFVFGALAGAAWTMLNTPRSGKETIGEIRARGRQLRSRGTEFADKAVSQAGDIEQKAHSQASDLAEQAQTQVQEAAEAMSDQAEKIGDGASGLAEETLDNLQH